MLQRCYGYRLGLCLSAPKPPIACTMSVVWFACLSLSLSSHAVARDMLVVQLPMEDVEAISRSPASERD